MKKLNLVGIVCLLLSLMFVLSACGGSKGPKQFKPGDLYKNVTDSSDPLLAAVTTFTNETHGDLSVAGWWSNFFYSLEGEDLKTLKIYNAITDQIVLTFTETETLKYEDLYTDSFADAAWFVLKLTDKTDSTKDVTVYRLYDANGTMIVEERGNSIRFDSACDTILLGDKLYRISKDGIVADGEFSALGYPELPDSVTKVGDIYYADGNHTLSVYDKNFNLILTHYFPLYAHNIEVGALSSKKLIAQYYYELPYDAEEYDAATEDEKYDLVTEIITVKDGSVKSVDSEYVFDRFFCREELEDMDENELAKGIDLIAYGYKIENKQWEINENLERIFSLDENGQVKAILSATVNGKIFSQPAEPIVGTDKYLVGDYSSSTLYIVDKKGEVIADISGVRSDSGFMTAKFLSAYGKIYDFDLNLVYDYEAAGMEVETRLQDSILFSKDSKTYLLKAGDTAPVELAGVFDETCYGMIMTKDEATFTTYYYNENGQELTKLVGTSDCPEMDSMWADASIGVVVMKYAQDSGTTYYRFHS